MPVRFSLATLKAWAAPRVTRFSTSSGNTSLKILGQCLCDQALQSATHYHHGVSDD